MNLLTSTVVAGLLVGAAINSALAQESEFPTSPVTLVVPFSAGGMTDLSAGKLPDGLAQLWHESVIVENKPGAGSMTGTVEVVNTEPDGHRLLYSASALSIHRAIASSLPFDPLDDLLPINLTGQGATIVAVGPNVRARTIDDLIAESRGRPMFYATSGSGSFNHLAGEALNLSLGTEMQAVHYKGGADAVNDVVGGRADIYLGGMPAVQGFVAGGQLRILATMTRERAPTLPDVPTLSELGYDDAEVYSWTGVFAPAGTPASIVDRINADIGKVVTEPGYREFLAANEMSATPVDPEAFKAFVERDMELSQTIARKRAISE